MGGQEAAAGTCPDCGTDLGSDPGTEGLCPRCLLSLALVDPALDAASDGDVEAPTLERPAAGHILGGRYQMRELLGRGGMGEVWRAFDLKLRVDVALKSVRSERVGSDRGREVLRQEVRSAREVVSPNVCRIFDLVEEEGREFVSMEYVDGMTLADALRERGPLELQDARGIASQFLSGLEAIHVAGLVHRDFKPENVMITRAGRVVVMDFGLARGLTETGTGTISGTPPYMPPEQARGDALDARADVFAAGIVLAEMLSVSGETLEARQALWHAVRETPPRVPEGPWSSVLRQALDPVAERRPASARALAHALEEVTLRLPGFEERRPYPGLSSFTEEDAEFFFGREVEVEAVWKRLKRPRLLALIGPSGTGKSSFLRAGLLSSLPGSWASVVATPGTRPFQALAQALAPSLAGDARAVQSLLGFEDPETAVPLVARWRQEHEHALVVVDQFEELFTQNAPEVQEAFARLLGRLVLEADAHVLLAMRDDFLFHCQAHEALAPILADLTLLGPLTESGLRRALVQPALACGYRFEDESLVEEMVGEVSRERGALPLLAFAASRLWEKRDRKQGLLTRETYEEIGGVAGALAQHAEATLERIGAHRASLVRELFRNLVTSQGTRAARERRELLSVFRDAETAAAAPTRPGSGGSESTTGSVSAWTREEAGEVLDSLIDARLLTSYERAGDEPGESRQEIEIIHESLLKAWPRLVRWQTQDADGAQLRDQLRQAAQAWADRGKPEDLLWSGTAYRDFDLWRERYPGGLTATEEAFAMAMKTSATRRRRRKRAAVAALVVAGATVAIVTSVLWRQADSQRRKAEAETLRAEASKLVVLGERELATYPTGALAYAIKSLELADTEPARLLALRVLQEAPVARIAQVGLGEANGAWALGLDFSPNGEWVAAGGFTRSEVLNRDGKRRLVLGDYSSMGQHALQVRFSPGSDALVADLQGDIRVWSIPEGRERRRDQIDEGPSDLVMGDDGYWTLTTVGDQEMIRFSPLGEGAARLVGTMDGLDQADIARGQLAYRRGRELWLRSLQRWDSPPRIVGKGSTEIADLALSAEADRLAVSERSGMIRVWPTRSPSPEPHLRFEAESTPRLRFDPPGRWLSARGTVGGRALIRLWEIGAPAGVAPITLQRGDGTPVNQIAFGPDGLWLATAHASDVALWWLGNVRQRILTVHQSAVSAVSFTPDGHTLVAASGDGTLRAWPLSEGSGQQARTLLRAPVRFPYIAMDPQGRNVAVSGAEGRVYVVPLSGNPARELIGFSSHVDITALAFNDEGRVVAAAPYIGPRAEKVIRVWNLETGAIKVLGPVPGAGDNFIGGTGNVLHGLTFMGRDRIVVCSSGTGLAAFDLHRGASTILSASPNTGMMLNNAHSEGLGVTSAGDPDDADNWELVRFRLDGSDPVALGSHGPASQLLAAAFDRSDRLLATGSADGTVRVGPSSGAEPHLLLGHSGAILSLAFSPDGRWLASGGADGTIRLWPVPDVSKPPPHTLPLDALLAKLRTHTNLRAVPDPASFTGYKLEPGPFPGWATPPEW